jgi:hypothetical protein
LGSINNKAHGCSKISLDLKKQGACHIVALAIIYNKRYIMAKEENYENSCISPSKNIIFIKKKSSKKTQSKSFKILLL